MLEPDDVVTFKMPGGAGYGPAKERDRDAVLLDVVQGYVSRDAAIRDYGASPDLLDGIQD
jgi:N-methylhydantoinase B/oxoprolinase/acetone carboxylase alpha subunit